MEFNIEHIFYSLSRCNFTLHDVKKELSRLSRIIKKEKVKSSEIIDFGCGDGSNTIKIASLLHAKEILGIDTNQQLLEEATKRKIKIMKHDLTKPIKLKKKYQMSLSYGVLHHLTNIKIAIKQMVRATKRYILIVDLCKKNNSIKHELGCMLFPFELGENIVSPDKILNVLKSSNVKILDCKIYSDVHPIFDRVVILGERQ